MTEEAYDIALRNALVEIKNAIPDINWSFALTKNGTVIASEENAANPNIEKAASSFQSLAEKARVVGGLDNMLIDGEKGKVYVSCVNDMYLITGLAKNADLVYYRTITGAVFPTILKVLDSLASQMTQVAPTPLKSPPVPYFPEKPAPSELEVQEEVADEELVETEEAQEPVLSEVEPPRKEAVRPIEGVPSQQLIVDRFGGLMVKSDTVQLDADVLSRWSSLLNGSEIREVDIETFGGKTMRLKVKIISDSKLEGRGLIRIPEKTCELLEIRRGELVRVKPVMEESE